MTVAVTCSCGKIFNINETRLKHGRGKHCSRKCQYASNSRKFAKEKVRIICQACQKEFFVIPSQGDTKFCSRECKSRCHVITKTRVDKGRRRVNVLICIECGKEFPRIRISKPKFCSDLCRKTSASRKSSGENNYFYKDGSSKLKKTYRGEQWNIIRLQVFQRDNFTCQECGVHCMSRVDSERMKNFSRTIQCHHITPYHKDGSNELENLITLCLPCHSKIEQRIVN